MRILLDTHALLWWLLDDPRLTEIARRAISPSAHQVLVSSASAWEIATKHRLGKLPEIGKIITSCRATCGRSASRRFPSASSTPCWPGNCRDRTGTRSIAC